jgi:hypothetical protein
MNHWVHTRIQEGIALTIRPMIKLQPNRLLYPLKSRGEERGSDSMDQDDLETPVCFPPKTPIIYEEDKLVEPNHSVTCLVRLDCMCQKQEIKSHLIPSSNSARSSTFSNSPWQRIMILKRHRGFPFQTTEYTPTEGKLAVCAHHPSWLRGRCQGDF